MYYVEKRGMYPQGVYYVCTDKEEAIRHADWFASNDEDNYHLWVVLKYMPAVYSRYSASMFVYETYKKDVTPDQDRRRR